MTDPVWVTEAAAHFHDGRYDEAGAIYEEALKYGPDDLLAMQCLGNVRLR